MAAAVAPPAEYTTSMICRSRRLKFVEGEAVRGEGI
jgi:hypothetical protein